MPYNGSGVASIPNSFTPATTILSSAMNANFVDIATMLSSVLVRDGQAAMSSALRLADGSEALPGLGFAGDTNTGIRRSAADVLELVTGGADRVQIDAAGKLWALGALDVAGLVNLQAVLTLINTGLHILDTDASHDLIVKPGSDLTADRTLSIVTGDADRSLTLQGDVTLPAGTPLIAANNLSDVANAATVRTNLGLGALAVESAPARAYGEYLTNGDITTAIPIDDTIPQNTEGDEILSVAITLKRSDSRVRATFRGWGQCEVNSNDDDSRWSAALFGSAADALTAAAVNGSKNNAGEGQANSGHVMLFHEEARGSVGPHTYTVRVGPPSGSTLRMNGNMTGRLFGGVAKATLVLQEVYV